MPASWVEVTPAKTIEESSPGTPVETTAYSITPGETWMFEVEFDGAGDTPPRTITEPMQSEIIRSGGTADEAIGRDVRTIISSPEGKSNYHLERGSREVKIRIRNAAGTPTENARAIVRAWRDQATL